MGMFSKILDNVKKIVTDVMEFNNPEHKLEKTIEKFNKKVEKVKERNPEIASFQPEKIDKERYKDYAPSDLKSEIESLKKYTKRGAEEIITSKTGNKVSKWEYEDIKKKVDTINKNREKQRKKAEQMEVTSRGENVGLKRGQMGSERLNELNPKTFNFDKIKGGKEWQKFKESVYNQASPQALQKKMEEYKANYITGLQNAFGDYANHIIDIINDLPAEVVVNTYYGEQEASINFIYDKIDMDFRLDVIEGIWNGAQEEYENEIHG